MSARILALLASLLIAASPLPAPRPAANGVGISGSAQGPLDPRASQSLPAGVPSPADPAVSGDGTPEPTAAPTPNSGVVSREFGVRGVASWFDAAPTLAAAGPALRKALGPDWRGTWVRVCAGSCVRVQLLDWCLCRVGDSERLIDLSRSAFGRLADPSRGLIMVEVVR